MSVETVLVTVGPDDGERVEALATTIADLADEETRVAVGYAYTESEYETARSQLRYNEATPDELAERNAVVRDLIERLGRRDVTVHGRVTTDGSRATDLSALAADVEADVAIVGGGDRTPTGKAVFGSFAQRVVLNAPCPVTVVSAS